jgi:type VI secretion system secreted protein VgrG
MSRDPKQTDRFARLETPLGADVLTVARFSGSEGLSEPFEYVIEALSTQENIDFDKALGQECKLQLRVTEMSGGRVTSQKERWFCGILVEAQWLGADDTYFIYRLVLRPWAWLLDHTTDCHIFNEMAVDEIVEKVLRDAGLGKLRLDLQGYPTLEYCVQYRETKFAFVSRLMEEYGIAYYFEHGSDGHTMVLADQKSAYKPIPKSETLPFIPVGSGREEVEHLDQWIAQRRFRTGKVTYRDYNYEKPNAEMEAEKAASEGYTSSDLEVYDYPGRYKERDDGVDLATVRLEGEQALDRRRIASGDSPTLYPGGLFALQDHPSGAENIQYLVVRANHAFEGIDYRSGGSKGSQDYNGTYELQPHDRQFRPLRRTPKPTIYGPQTARVHGEGGEIDVDEQGRILLCFHWDRKKEIKYRVRVAQVWSGRDWGGVFIPRIDQEVVVEFLEGDIDRPLVTGTVYNGKNTMPFGTKPDKTINGWRSDSTVGGGGYNEFVFDDEKGAERVSMRAEKDHQVLVRDAGTAPFGEAFTADKGPASRKATLKKGDDKLDVENGNQNVWVSKEITVEAGQKITLKVGASTIVMDGQSITLKSPQITAKADATFTATSPKSEVKGDAVLILQGGIVKIN